MTLLRILMVWCSQKRFGGIGFFNIRKTRHARGDCASEDVRENHSFELQDLCGGLSFENFEERGVLITERPTKRLSVGPA